MLFEVVHKNGNVRSLVVADDAEDAYAMFRQSRLAEGINPIRSNHAVFPVNGVFVNTPIIRLANPKDTFDGE